MLLKIIVICFSSCFLYYILFKIFDYFKKYKLALYCLALSDAPLFGKNAIKIRDYCVKNCSSKKCENCIYWTCENYVNGVNK